MLNKIKKDIVFCNVYVASVESERRELWDFILSSQQSFSAPWVVGGDFNTVLDSSERKGEGCNLGSIRNFNSFVLQARVVDIPLLGNPFTWSNNRDKESWARLDHYLLAPDILSWFPSLKQTGLPWYGTLYTSSLNCHFYLKVHECYFNQI